MWTIYLHSVVHKLYLNKAINLEKEKTIHAVPDIVKTGDGDDLDAF